MKPVLLIYTLLVLFTFSCQRETSEILPETPDVEETELKITSFAPSTAKEGDTVFVKGAGFDKNNIAANQLYVNNVLVTSIVKITDSTINFKITNNLTTGVLKIQVGNKTFTTVDVLTITTIVVIQPEEWVKRADLNSIAGGFDVDFVSSFSINTKGYYLRKNHLWEYDSVTNIWTEKALLPGNEKNFNFAFVIGGKAYVGLGAKTPGMPFTADDKKIWEYNPANNTWTEKNNFPGGARVSPFSFSIGTKGYVGGGDTGNNGMQISKDFWEYNSADDSWKQLKDFTGNRGIGLTGISANNAGFVFELSYGNPTAPFGSYKDVFLWKYDAGVDSWEKLSSVPSGTKAYSSGTAVILGNTIYVALGTSTATVIDGKDFFGNFWKYDISTKTWAEKIDIGGGARHFPVGFVLGKSIYMGLGTGTTVSNRKNDFWRFTPNN